MSIGGAFVAEAINDGEGGDVEVRQGLMIRGTAALSTTQVSVRYRRDLLRGRLSSLLKSK